LLEHVSGDLTQAGSIADLTFVRDSEAIELTVAVELAPPEPS
jgi:hypothetical protein